MNIHDYTKNVENRSKGANRFRDLVLQAKRANPLILVIACV